MERNLTGGSVMKNLVSFSLPFLLSYLLQTFYGLADLFIIGRFCPTQASSAVAIGSQIMHMATVMIVGLSMGSTVLIGKAVGAGDRNARNTAVGNTVVIFALLSVVATALSVANISRLIRLMSTPEAAVDGTHQYLLICFAGIPFIVAYNIISAIFRGMGDSKSPMYFVAVACVCNVALDVLLIGGAGLGPAGAALGTTVSQAVSVLVAVAAIVKKQMISGLSKPHFRPEKSTAGSIFKVGLPVAAQDGFIQVAFLLVTIFANRRGLVDSTAVGIVEKVIGIVFLVPSTLLSSVSAMCSQNIGAGKHLRAKKTMQSGLVLAIGWGVIVSVLFQFIAPQVVGIFTKDSAVVLAGSQYLRSYVWDCILASIHFIFSGYFCAYSRSGISFVHNMISALCARIPLSYYASVKYTKTLFPMGLAAPAGSALSIVICVVAYLFMQKKIPYDEENKAK